MKNSVFHAPKEIKPTTTEKKNKTKQNKKWEVTSK